MEYYTRLRAETLGDTTPAWHARGDLFTCSFVKSAFKEYESAVVVAVVRAIESAEELGGTVQYVGRALRVVVKSAQLPDVDDRDVDVVLVFRWTNPKGFEIFNKEVLGNKEEWAMAKSQGYRRNPHLVHLAYFGLHVAWFLQRIGLMSKASLKSQSQPPEDLSTVELPSPGAKMVSASQTYAKMLDSMQEIEPKSSEDENEPVYIWNWLQPSEDPATRSKDERYGRLMMSMLSSLGGGIMLFAEQVVTPDSESGKFSTIAAVCYPSRRMLIDLLTSEWMAQTATGKAPGDSIAVATVPFTVDGKLLTTGKPLKPIPYKRQPVPLASGTLIRTPAWLSSKPATRSKVRPFQVGDRCLTQVGGAAGEHGVPATVTLVSATRAMRRMDGGQPKPKRRRAARDAPCRGWLCRWCGGKNHHFAKDGMHHRSNETKTDEACLSKLMREKKQGAKGLPPSFFRCGCGQPFGTPMLLAKHCKGVNFGFGLDEPWPRCTKPYRMQEEIDLDSFLLHRMVKARRDNRARELLDIYKVPNTDRRDDELVYPHA
ncbi:Uncharacterized protein SCF082_LOCUS3473, partial [Durusdinium trenchii]